MGFEQLAKLKEQFAKEAKAQRQKQAAASKADGAKPAASKPAGAKPAGAKPAGAKPSGAKPAAPKTAGARSAGPKAAAPRSGAKREPVDPVVHTIGKLQKRFPAAFPKNPAPKVALKIGILQDVLAHAQDLGANEQELRDAIATWCRGSRYWACLKEGELRMDLTGAEAGKVTASDAAFARRQSSRRPKAAKAANEAGAAVGSEQSPSNEVGAAAGSEQSPSNEVGAAAGSEQSPSNEAGPVAGSEQSPAHEAGSDADSEQAK